ncbi:MAG: hypothetical protein ACR2FV_03235 [Ornithinimicrobium sp.]|uniref:hypothetical protein n=1 Tax=Ornithinimicrobium sp. TaxID=1977084 RepID=UPI003D9B2ABF
MLALVLGMFFCVAVSAAVIGYVAREAQRDSRDFWTPEGERMIADVRRRGTDLRARGEGLRQRMPSAAGRSSSGLDS